MHAHTLTQNKSVQVMSVIHVSISSQDPNIGHSPVPVDVRTKGRWPAQLAAGVALSHHAVCSCFDHDDLSRHRVCQRHIAYQCPGC